MIPSRTLPPNTAPSHSQLEENARRVARRRIAGTFAQQKEEPFTEVLQGVCVSVCVCGRERGRERERERETKGQTWRREGDIMVVRGRAFVVCTWRTADEFATGSPRDDLRMYNLTSWFGFRSAFYCPWSLFRCCRPSLLFFLHRSRRQDVWCRRLNCLQHCLRLVF